jgi:hypothetical protein
MRAPVAADARENDPETAPPSLGGAWLAPMAALAVLSLGIFAALYLLDHYLTGGHTDVVPDHPLARYFLFDPQGVSDAASALGGLVAAVLGIVITVVSIVVQLSSGKYAGVAAKFFNDRTNQAVLGFYVVACVLGVWLSVSVRGDYVPRAAIIAMLGITTLGLVLMAPYFAYVFWFLEPENIIGGIRREAAAHVAIGGSTGDELVASRMQASVVGALEEFTDIASGAINGKDKIIASRAVDALKDLCVGYIQRKRGHSASWFRLGTAIRRNPAFVAMDPESRVDLEQRRMWFEWKVLRQLLGIFQEALGPMRDVAYLVAIDARYIGEAAGAAGDDEGVALVQRYMNSFMRATLNARDVRTAYNVLNQYRLFVESLLRMKRGDDAITGLAHMKYYGHVGQELKLNFITETVGFDMADACRLASELGAPEEERFLDHFLDLDRPLARGERDAALAGVRKAQAKLGAYYLLRGKTVMAARVRDDMRKEPAGRLRMIRDELLRVESKDFWEIIDRGRNFEYMPGEQRAKLKDFFAFLDEPAEGPREPADA